VLERLAKVLGVEIVELFRIPRAGEKKPKTLPKGRRRVSDQGRASYVAELSNKLAFTLQHNSIQMRLSLQANL
jgi:hypothetical protein